MSEYTASSIKVLSHQEAIERFPFARAGEIARQHPSVSTEFIERLLEACALSGWEVDQAVQRYCAKDKSIPVPDGFRDVYTEIMYRDRRQAG